MATEFNAVGYAARDASGHLSPIHFNRRVVGSKDVKITITHCGICHSDLHQIRNEWKTNAYPIVPGHEIVGIVTELGEEAKSSEFSVGDRVGVGCMVNSCRTCPECQQGDEQYCCSRPEGTYGRTKNGDINYGGYSSSIVVDRDFVVRIPENLPLDKVAPLLCAGITVFSPLKYFARLPNQNIGVLGMGGLGHVAVMIASAMGHNVSVISSSSSKRDEAFSFGARNFIVSSNPEDMERNAKSLDLIINTISAPHELRSYLSLLKTGGQLILLGAPPAPYSINAFELIARRLSVAGSLIGGIRETQEMLDFCGQHNILPLTELIPIQKVNEAMDRLQANDVRYRFVIDIQNTLQP